MSFMFSFTAPRRIFVACLALAGAGALSLNLQGTPPPTITLDCGIPKADGDETLTITFKVGAETKTLTVQTGQTGSANTADDIKKTMTAAEKATKIKNAINAASDASADGDPVTASVASDLITIVPNGTNKLVKVSPTNNTNERHKITNGDPGISEPGETLLGIATLSGSISGTPSSGSTAYVTVGTDRAETTINTAGYTSVATLARAIADDLVSRGISATSTASGEVFIIYDEAYDGRSVIMDVNDTTLLSTSTLTSFIR